MTDGARHAYYPWFLITSFNDLSIEITEIFISLRKINMTRKFLYFFFFFNLENTLFEEFSFFFFFFFKRFFLFQFHSATNDECSSVVFLCSDEISCQYLISVVKATTYKTILHSFTPPGIFCYSSLMNAWRRNS